MSVESVLLRSLLLSWKVRIHSSFLEAPTPGSVIQVHHVIPPRICQARAMCAKVACQRLAMATHTVNIKEQFKSKDGTSTTPAVLTDVGYNPKMNYNLFSLSRMLVNGWTIINGLAIMGYPLVTRRATSSTLTLLSRLHVAPFLLPTLNMIRKSMRPVH